jgi:hypothetical protein
LLYRQLAASLPILTDLRVSSTLSIECHTSSVSFLFGSPRFFNEALEEEDGKEARGRFVREEEEKHTHTHACHCVQVLCSVKVFEAKME